MIPEEMLTKYHIPSLDELKSQHGDNTDTELLFYRMLLIQTDHIPNKIIEAQVLRTSTVDYSEILQCRQAARDKINELEELVETEATDDPVDTESTETL